MAKILVVTDSHAGSEHLDTVPNPAAGLAALEKAIHCSPCDGIVFCGDMIHDKDPEPAKEYMRNATAILRSAGVPVWIIPGNHDLYCFGIHDFLHYTGQKALPFSVDFGSSLLLFVDACYHENGTRFFDDGMVPNWVESYVPEDQLKQIQMLLRQNQKPVIVFSHQSLDPYGDPDYVIRNAESIRKLFKNEGKGLVRHCICGHTHEDLSHTIDGICYRSVSSINRGQVISADSLFYLEV